MRDDAEKLILLCLELAAEKGKLDGQRELLLRWLRRRFGGAVDGWTAHRIMNGSAEEVDRWADRILSVSTAAELFAD